MVSYHLSFYTISFIKMILCFFFRAESRVLLPTQNCNDSRMYGDIRGEKHKQNWFALRMCT